MGILAGKESKLVHTVSQKLWDVRCWYFVGIRLGVVGV